MSNNSPSSLRFSFTKPPKAIMEFIGSSSTDSRPEDIYSKCDLLHIQLYTYDWTITNFSMMKPVSEAALSPIYFVGPLKNMEFKIFLSYLGDENIKLEVQLSKETKLTEEMKAKEVSCPLTSKHIKHILSLEFLDSNGKTIDYYKSLPYEFKYINTSKVFAWIKEENVGRFLHNDSLTIRAKLSMRFYAQAGATSSESLKPTKVLMDDMKSLFNDRSCFPDVLIKVGGQYVVSHKSILYTQCPYFAEMAKANAGSSDQALSSLKIPGNISNIIKDDCELLCIPNENADVFLSVLHFIYCKQMYVTDTVNDFAVYEFAKKYGIRELSMLLMPGEIKVHSVIKVEKLSYTWYVKKFSSLRKGGFTPIQSSTFKTDVGKETVAWNVILFCLDSENIILNLQRVSGLNSDVQTSFKLAVCRADGSIHDEREFKNLFTSGTALNCYPGFMDSVSRFTITPNMLYNDTLAVCCDLVVSVGELSSNVKYCYPGEHPDIDVAYWTDNFQKLLETENFSDATLIVEDEEFKVHKVILSARSPVFSRMFENDMEEKRSGCARIEDVCSAVMKQTLAYIYTGKLDNLTMAHAPELYCTADKYEIMDLKDRCSDFIMKNIDADSSCEILILADLYNDEKMKKAAKNIICRNAAQALLSTHGIKLITNHSTLAHDIFETLSAVFCSLPPQDAYESHKSGAMRLTPPLDFQKIVLSDKLLSPSLENRKSIPCAVRMTSPPSLPLRQAEVNNVAGPSLINMIKSTKLNK